MEKSEFRAVIKHLYLKGLTPKEIKAELDEVHGTSAPVFPTVYNWGVIFNKATGARDVIVKNWKSKFEKSKNMVL